MEESKDTKLVEFRLQDGKYLSDIDNTEVTTEMLNNNPHEISGDTGWVLMPRFTCAPKDHKWQEKDSHGDTYCIICGIVPLNPKDCAYPRIKPLSVYLFRVADYTTELIGQYDEVKDCYFVQRGDGVKYEYESYRIIFKRKLL